MTLQRIYNWTAQRGSRRSAKRASSRVHTGRQDISNERLVRFSLTVTRKDGRALSVGAAADVAGEVGLSAGADTLDSLMTMGRCA